MPMTRTQFINAVIDDGLEEVKRVYTRPDQSQKLEGAIAGFEACRDKDNDALLTLLDKAKQATKDAHKSQDPDYWKIRTYEAQVEWTLNVISAAMLEQGVEPLTDVTMPGYIKASNIAMVHRNQTRANAVSPI